MDAVAFPAMPAEPDKAPRSVSSLAAGTSRASPNRGHPCCLSTETKQVGFNYKG